MDRKQEDMQCLGLFGIYKEAYKMIFSWRKVFTQITLTLILPVLPLFFVIQPVGAPEYNKLSDLLTFEWITFCLFKAAYYTFSLIFSQLPSTSAVVYTIACIYTGREVTFKKVTSVVPKVWKRLMLTFVSTFIALFAYSIVALPLMSIFIFLVSFLVSSNYLVLISFVLGFILYMVGVLYMVIVGQLAGVVTVLEGTCGFHAMRKSKALIKGKTGVATVIFLMFNISTWLIHVAFEKLVVRGESMGMVNSVAYGIICSLLLFKLNLFKLAIQTVIYLVCKSYHHEYIDKLALSDHFEVNLGHYVPLKAKDHVQLEQIYVD